MIKIQHGLKLLGNKDNKLTWSEHELHSDRSITLFTNVRDVDRKEGSQKGVFLSHEILLKVFLGEIWTHNSIRQAQQLITAGGRSWNLAVIGITHRAGLCSASGAHTVRAHLGSNLTLQPPQCCLVCGRKLARKPTQNQGECANSARSEGLHHDYTCIYSGQLDILSPAAHTIHVRH